ncbi:MAG: hypothetical protein PUD07_04125 [bacterium]|nr:hypothetical protein [bacterium]
MEEKNYKNVKVVAVVASAFLLFIIFAAAFAYFGTFNIDLNNNVAVNIYAQQGGASSFTATAAQLNLQVPASAMSQSNSESGNAVLAAENTATLNVTLKGAEGMLTTCTYNIIYEYDNTSETYGNSVAVTSGADKEITLQVSGASSTSNYYETERNFNYYSGSNGEDTTDVWESSTKRYLVKEAKISSAGTEVTSVWNITGRYYNLDVSQSQLEGKSFTGKIYVDPNYDCSTSEDKTLYSLVRKKYNEGNTFVKLYDGEGSDTYVNPVYYYNGAVQDNNVLFANFCWKIVRTTDTGGVKLIYNGTPKTTAELIPLEESQYLNLSNDASYPYTFDSTNKTWTSTNKTDSATGTITFTVAEAGDYVLSYTVSSEGNYDKAIFYKDDTVLDTYSGEDSGSITLDGLTTSNVIKVEYTKDESEASGSDNVVFSLGKPSGNSYLKCNNTGTDSQIGKSSFNSSYTSPAYVGYMYNTVYTSSNKSMSSLSNIVFGNSFTYSGGTYTLTDTMAVATLSSGYNTINNNHYTCFTTGTTCSDLYYVYYTSSYQSYYITLTGGKSVGDALNEMLYADDVNKTDSVMKTYIETWYENNMTAYTSYLEDTTYCNDRSINDLGGWNPNGGSTTGSSYYLQFKNYNTNYSLVCGNVTDQFRVGNTKAPLKYPVGLLTAPEVCLAYKDASYSTYYLNTGEYYWLGSPGSFYDITAYGRNVNSSGSMSVIYPVYDSIGARPSVSLKPGTGYISGNGSYTSPYLIE